MTMRGGHFLVREFFAFLAEADMLVASLILAALVVLAANVAARKSGSLALPCWIAGLSILLGWPCVQFPALMLNGVLMLLAALSCWLTSAKPRFFLIGSLGSFALSHALVGISVFKDIREDQTIRETYPTQSLADRLAYEKKRPETRLDTSNPFDPTPPPASALNLATRQPLAKMAAYQQLNELEDRIESEGQMRAHMLQRLHDGAVEDFINSPGFGISRGVRRRWKYVELPEAEPIPLRTKEEDPSYLEESASPEQVSSSSPADTLGTLPEEVALQKMHHDGVVDFINPKGLGYVKDREHVIGFQAHQFRALPKVPESPAKNLRWRIQSLELVSLLKHEEPVVYLSEHLPRMDELRDAKTRPLSAFEKQALAVLQGTEDLKIESTANRIQMLGSIRAVKQCLSCHSVERGELLGAFSYTLRRDPPLP